MPGKLTVRRLLLAGIAVLLLVLAWGALSGGVSQLPRSTTVGQQVETVVQLVCGLLSLLMVFTCFWWRAWARIIRIAWAASLTVVAGLSPLVWGPPMPLMALALAAVALLIALAITSSLPRLARRVEGAVEQPDRGAAKFATTVDGIERADYR